jgi:hypothetical protein
VKETKGGWHTTRIPFRYLSSSGSLFKGSFNLLKRLRLEWPKLSNRVSKAIRLTTQTPFRWIKHVILRGQ